MKNRILVGTVIAAVVLLAAGAAAIAGPFSSGSASALPSTCGPLFYKGSGKPQFIVVSDLPLQGAGRAQNLLMGQAIRYVLQDQYKFKAGKYTVGYQECDDSTAQAGAVRHGEVLVERTSLRRDVERDRGARDVQLGLREARAPDPEPGPGRKRRNAQLGEHRASA